MNPSGSGLEVLNLGGSGFEVLVIKFKLKNWVSQKPLSMHRPAYYGNVSLPRLLFSKVDRVSKFYAKAA